MSTPAGNHALGEVRKVLHGVRIADCPPELREKLAQYDTNGNGIIDPNELPDPMSAEMTYLKVSSFPKKVHPLLHEIDDEKNGKIEMDELTEILTVYVDLKKANKEGSIAIKTLPKEIQPTLKVFDVDGDGTVAPMELARGAELYKDSKKTAKRLTIFSGVLLLILCALVGVIVGLVAVVVEASKETKTDSKTGITYAKGSSKPSATAKVTKTDSIYDAVKKSESALRAIGSLTLGKPDGSSLMYTVTGAETHGGAPGKANAVAFYSARGDVINVTATSLKVTKENGTIVMTDTVVAEKSRRRRLLGSGSTGTCNAKRGVEYAGKTCRAEWTYTDYCGVEKQSGCTNCDNGKDGNWCLFGNSNNDYCFCDPPGTSSTQASTTSTEGTDSEGAAATCSAEKETIKKLEAALKVAANDEATAAKAAQKEAAALSKLVVADNDDLRARVKAWLNDPAKATDLYGDIYKWDTSKVTDMSNMFYGARSFNQDISWWYTSKVTDMSNMFNGATSFDQDISRWYTSKVTDMSNMFNGATDFGKDISGWDTSKVTDMSNMFTGATYFNNNQKITASCENNKCTLKKP
ncbi:hypothetical protein PPROV_000818500 [Pycnococcus provasolii]|uniref:EF-hand domain-containing protein n=1 Tax=Pycnococcus provasolii TaxID=41880 RepID=A0A830HUL1_9CHLO|nr:hypothetical protein PPROV_000818500 [Pycnococcus provasolii]